MLVRQLASATHDRERDPAVSERVDIDRDLCRLHAAERIGADRRRPGCSSASDLTIFDVVRCFITGRIFERQWDGKRGEWKYLVHGMATDHTGLVAAVKIGPTRRLVIVTVYRVNGEGQ